MVGNTFPVRTFRFCGTFCLIAIILESESTAKIVSMLVTFDVYVFGHVIWREILNAEL
jgi:hypothetical protein